MWSICRMGIEWQERRWEEQSRSSSPGFANQMLMRLSRMALRHSGIQNRSLSPCRKHCLFPPRVNQPPAFPAFAWVVEK